MLQQDLSRAAQPEGPDPTGGLAIYDQESFVVVTRVLMGLVKFEAQAVDPELKGALRMVARSLGAAVQEYVQALVEGTQP